MPKSVLEQLIDKTEGSSGSTKKLSMLLADVEQILFDRIEATGRYTDVEGAKQLLNTLHSSQTNTFQEYLQAIDELPLTQYSIDLQNLMEAVNELPDIPGALEQIAEGEMAPRESIIPESFWADDGGDAIMLPVAPEQENPSYGLHELGAEQEIPSEQIFNRFYSVDENFSPTDAIKQSYGVDDIQDLDPVMVERTRDNLLNLWDEATSGQPAVAALDYPTGFELDQGVYEGIRNYFNRDWPLSMLSRHQQNLIDTLSDTPEEFAQRFSNDIAEGSRVHELRTLLKHDLASDGVFSHAEMEDFMNRDSFPDEWRVQLPEVPDDFPKVKYDVADETKPWEKSKGDPALEHEELLFPEEPAIEKENILPEMKRWGMAEAKEIPHPIVREPIPQDILLDMRRAEEAGNKEVRAMVYEFPDESNEQLLRRFQKMSPDAPLPGDYETRFAEYLHQWDAERVWVAKGFTQEMAHIHSEQVGDLFAGLVESEGASSVRANLAFSRGAVMVKDSWLKGVLLKQLKTLPVGLAIINPMLQHINEANPRVGSFVNIGLAVGEFATGLAEYADPIGLGMAAFAEVGKELAFQAQRKLDNQDPTQWDGDRFGYVRTYKNGIQKWSPAVVRAVHREGGFGNRDSELVMETGDDLLWVMDGEGNVAPHFSNPIRHNFDVHDAELESGSSGVDYINQHDFTRDFYLLKPNEQQAILGNIGSETDLYGVEPFEERVVDTSNMNQFENKLTNWETAINVVNDWKNNPIGKATGTETGFWNEYGATRALRDQRESFWGDQYTFWLRANYSRTGMTDEQVAGDRFGNFDQHPENMYIMKTQFMDSLKVLLKSQQHLATESGYDRYSMHANWEADNPAPTDWQREGRKQTEHEQTHSSQLYRGRDIIAAQTPEELSTQLRSFEEDKSLSTEEANFLAAKAATRYWSGQIIQYGGFDTFKEFTTTQKHMKTQRGRGGRVRDAEIEDDNTPYSLLMRDLYPWANKGEGLIPKEYINRLDGGQQTFNANIAQASDAFLNNFETRKDEILAEEKAKAEHDAMVKEKREAWNIERNLMYMGGPAKPEKPETKPAKPETEPEPEPEKPKPVDTTEPTGQEEFARADQMSGHQGKDYQGKMIYLDGKWVELASIDLYGGSRQGRGRGGGSDGGKGYALVTLADGTTTQVSKSRGFYMQDKEPQQQSAPLSAEELAARKQEQRRAEMAWYMGGEPTPKPVEPKPELEVKPGDDGKMAVHYEGEQHGLAELLDNNPDLAGALQQHLDTFEEAAPDEMALQYDTTVEGETEERDAILEYLANEHKMILKASEVTPENLPFLAFDREGHVALHGDEQLHEELGLGSNIAVVKTAEGQIQQVYTPFQHD